VVDPEPHVVNILRSLPDAQAHTVETVGDGFQALRRVQAAPAPDLILLDVAIPGLEGLETL
jgi:CheY-like chemotaxis protein